MTHYNRIKEGKVNIDILLNMGITEFSANKLRKGLPYSNDVILKMLDMPFVEFGGADFSIIRAFQAIEKPNGFISTDLQTDVVIASILGGLVRDGIDVTTVDYLHNKMPHTLPLLMKIRTMSPVSAKAHIRQYIEAEGLEHSEGDKRYNNPKGAHGFPKADIDKAIDANAIYSELRERLLNAQRGQVGYGLAKYPETLNKDSWNTIETLNHIIEESVDQLHYFIMLKMKMEQETCESPITDWDWTNLKSSNDVRPLGEQMSMGLMAGMSKNGQDCDGDKMTYAVSSEKNGESGVVERG